MIERLRTLPSHRRMTLLIRWINAVLVLAVLAFAARGVIAPGAEGGGAGPPGPEQLR